MLRSPGLPSQRASSQRPTSTPPRTMSALIPDLAVADRRLQALEPGPARAVVELADAHEGGEGGVVDARHEEPVLHGVSRPGDEHEPHHGDADPCEPKWRAHGCHTSSGANGPGAYRSAVPGRAIARARGRSARQPARARGGSR